MHQVKSATPSNLVHASKRRYFRSVSGCTSTLLREEWAICGLASISELISDVSSFQPRLQVDALILKNQNESGEKKCTDSRLKITSSTSGC
ncbi:hypothetical protein TKK_0018922 [Trichogramma kaykai]